MLALDIETHGSPYASSPESHLLSSFMKIPTASSRTSSLNYLKSETLKQVSFSIRGLNIVLLLLSPASVVGVYLWYYSVIALILALFLSVCQGVVAVYGLKLEKEITPATIRFYRRSVKAFLMLIIVFLAGMQLLFLTDRWKVQSRDCVRTGMEEVCQERNGALSLDLLLYVLLPLCDILLYFLCTYSCRLVSRYSQRLKQRIKEDTWWSD